VNATIDPVPTHIPEFEVLETRSPFLLRWKNPPNFSRAELLRFIETNDELEIERECDGSILISPGVTFKTNLDETEVVFRLRVWAEKDGTGVALGPTGRYEFPNRATRGPDAAWIRRERVANLSKRQIRDILRLVPDFVVEVRSKSNSLRRLKAKMEEWIANGVRLGWLLDEHNKVAYVYRPGAEVQVLENATSLDASPELPGFVLDLTPIWA
jgi:Uma2 family endonuclease